MIIALVLVAAGRQKSPFEGERQVQEVRERISRLSEDFLAIRGITTEADPTHLRIRAEIDGYIRTAFSAAQTTSNDVEGRLGAVLADHIPNPEFGDEAFAHVEDLRRGRSLVVAYTVTRPPHHNLATIRGYRSVQGRFELVAVAGEEFGQYNMFKAGIPSPIDGEFWLLAWGQNHTSNGPVIRFRVYSFDGGTFKTVWRPEDLFDASVTITDRGFLIEHRSPRRAPYRTKDEYLVTSGGPIKAGR
jgi:hypothetical protein